MHRFATYVFTLTFALPAMAQDTQALAKAYTELPAVQNMMDNMFGGDAMAKNLAVRLPRNLVLDDAQMTAISEVIANSIADLRPVLATTMIESFATEFSAEELEAMIDFYSSDIGSAVMAKNQTVMAAVMASIGPQMQKAQRSVTPQIMKIMTEGQ